MILVNEVIVSRMEGTSVNTERRSTIFIGSESPVCASPVPVLKLMLTLSSSGTSEVSGKAGSAAWAGRAAPRTTRIAVRTRAPRANGARLPGRRMNGE